MPCRGGLFRDRQVTLLTNDVKICENNVKSHWDDYVSLSKRVLRFYKDNDGNNYLELDAYDTFKEQIIKNSMKFSLNSTLRASEQNDLETMFDLIARAVFSSRSGCPQIVRQKLGECQGDGN
jgi:hypothetical protein